MLTRDEAATKARHFADKRSYVRFDKREVLYGEDWKNRKQEIWERGNGRCERMVIVSMMPNVPNERCRNEMHDPHHIKPRSKGRDDRAGNLIALCRMHHDLLDERVTRFGEKGKPVCKRK